MKAVCTGCLPVPLHRRRGPLVCCQCLRELYCVSDGASLVPFELRWAGGKEDRSLTGPPYALPAGLQGSWSERPGGITKVALAGLQHTEGFSPYSDISRPLLSR